VAASALSKSDKRSYFANSGLRFFLTSITINNKLSVVVMHTSWRLANCRLRRQFQGCEKVGIFAVKVEQPSLVNIFKEMASSSFAA
jgi:hypothetical protein